MPWSRDNLPVSAKNISDDCVDVFIRVANASLENGDDEQRAIQNGHVAANNCEGSKGH